MNSDLLKHFSSLVLQHVAPQVRLPGEPATTSVHGTLAWPLWTDRPADTTVGFSPLTNFHIFYIFTFASLPKKMTLTAPVCSVSCSFSLHSLLNAAAQPLWPQAKSCSRGPPTLGLPCTPFIVLHPRTRQTGGILSTLLGAAARLCRSYRLVAALDWLIGGGCSGPVEVDCPAVQVCGS